MELRTELANGDNKNMMLQDESLKAILFHFIIKRTGQRTDKAHIPELQKSSQLTSKQPNSLMHVTGLGALINECTNPSYFHN